jgi:hypothetical protein
MWPTPLLERAITAFNPARHQSVGSAQGHAARMDRIVLPGAARIHWRSIERRKLDAGEAIDAAKQAGRRL